MAFFSEDLRPVGITLKIIQCCWTNWKHKIKAKKKVKKGNKCRKMEQYEHKMREMNKRKEKYIDK